MNITLLSWAFICPLVAILIFSTTIFLKSKKIHNNNNMISKRKLPPGEMGLPWIGETMEFYKAQKHNRLFEDFVQPRISKHGNIFKTSLMGFPTVVVNGAEANRFLLSNEFKLVISSWPTSSIQLMGKNSIMEKQGQQHRCVRELIAGSLSPTKLEALVPKMCNSVKSHLHKNWNGGRDKIISLYRSTKIITFTVVFECLLGINLETIEILTTFERVLEGVFAVPIAIPGSRFWRAKKARKEVEAMLIVVVKKKMKEMEIREGLGLKILEEETLLGRLVGGMIRGYISEEEVIDNVVLLVFAAHDTTSFAIATVFKMLAKHPDCYSLLLQEHAEIMKKKREDEKNLTMEDMKKMRYTWEVACESMRLFPPIFGSFRKAITDFEFQGFTIPQGWKILWTTHGTHYNEEYFEDPKSFKPGRFEETIQPYVYLPFGAGPRVCAGNQLAKLSILIFVHYVVTLYDWSLLNPDEQFIMDPLPFPSLGMPMLVSPK